MRRLVIIVAMLALAGSPLSAQQANQSEDNQITMSDLLRQGFDIVAMQYLTQSILFTLQRSQIAYICDANLQGETKLCLRLK